MNQVSLKHLVLGVALPLLGLVLLGLAVGVDRTLLAWDTTFLLRLHDYALPSWNRSVAIATNLGTTWGVLPASVLLIAFGLWRRYWITAFYLTLVTGGSSILNPAAKLLWHRVRPALWDGVPPHADFSFPSGHATYSMTLVAALLVLNWHNRQQRNWLLLTGSLFVLAIGFTRVYLGVHYPSDILGGWCLAIAWAVGLYQLLQFLTERLSVWQRSSEESALECSTDPLNSSEC